MKVTITNRSRMTAVGVAGPQDRWIRSLVDATGKAAELTKEGCWSRILTCPYPRPDTILMITAAPPVYWTILPRSAVTLFIEVSRDFVLPSHGEYTLSSEITGLCLTSKTFIDPYRFDDKQAKPIGTLRLKPIQFIVLA